MHYLDEWCRAINQHGGFGKWSWAVSFDPNDLDDILSRETKLESFIDIDFNTKTTMTPELITATISAGMRL